MIRAKFLAVFGLLLATTLSALAGPITAEQRTEIVRIVGERVTRLAFVPGADFSVWPDILTKFQARIDASETEEALTAVLNEALGEFKCSHLVVISPEANRARKTGTRSGIGIYTEITPEGIKVNGTVPNSPAEKVGLKDGDIIILVNGSKPTSTEAFAGEIGTAFKLRVRTPDGKVKEIEVTKAVFSIREPETLKWINDTTAILRIPSFENYNAKTVAQLMLDASKAKYLAVDMRGNPGGYVYNMINFAGYFLPKGAPMGTMLNRYIVNKYVKETGQDPKDVVKIAEWCEDKITPGRVPVDPFAGKVAVLVDGGTGSAAEMMSAALQDVVGAKVFGQKSIGMVLAATMNPLPDDFAVMIPVQDYVTIKGNRLEGHGVVPDVPVKAAGKFGGDDDAVLLAFTKWVAEQTKH